MLHLVGQPLANRLHPPIRLRVKLFSSYSPLSFLGMAANALALVFFIAGCKSAPTPVNYARGYPVDIAREPKTLDIQVFRHTYSVSLINTAPRSFASSTLWLNRRFSTPINGLQVAEEIELPLKEFADEFSNTFRGGGFFASEAPDSLVMAELETTDEQGQTVMFALVVVRGNPEN